MGHFAPHDLSYSLSQLRKGSHFFRMWLVGRITDVGSLRALSSLGFGYSVWRMLDFHCCLF